MSAKRWFEVRNKAAAEPVEILIYDQIGKDFWDGSGVAAGEFAEALKDIPRDREIVVGINSPGGSVWDGLAIYHQLQARRDKVVCRVDGVALSAASFIACAGRETQMPKSAMMMIHDPHALCVGTAADMGKMAEELKLHSRVIAGIYQTKSGKPIEDILAKMTEETWFDGEQAREFGLVNTVTNAAPIAASFDLSKFNRVPEQFRGPTTAAKETKTKGHVMNDNASPATTPAPAPAVPQPQPAPAATPPPTATVDLTPVLSAITGLTNRIIAIENRIVAPDGGVAAIRASASTGNEGPMDHVRAMKTPRERYSFMRNNWEDLRASISRSPRAANTTSSTLVTSFLTDGAITILQSRLAPLMAFALDFRTDPVKPLATMQVRKVTAGGTAQSNATDFEDTTNFVATNTHVTITPAQLTAGSHITNAEINSGHRMAHWVDVKAAEIGDKIMAAVAAVITTGNFTATPVTSVAAAFGWDELKSLWGQLKKSTIKNLILDGEYFARFIPETRENWDGTTGRLPGWDGFYLNTYWTGATANTVGFACNPQAIVVGAGPPEVAGSASQAGLRTSNFVVPGLQLTIQQNEWFSLKYRIDWATYDIVFGAAACDTTAGVLVKSA